MRGNAGQIRPGYFDKIAEDRVVTHLERLDSRRAKPDEAGQDRHRIHRERFRLPSTPMADHRAARALACRRAPASRVDRLAIAMAGRDRSEPDWHLACHHLPQRWVAPCQNWFAQSVFAVPPSTSGFVATRS